VTAASPGRIFQPVRGRGLRKLLWKRLHLPRSLVHPLLSAAKTAANPAQVRLRRELALQLGAESRAVGRIPPDRGFLLLPAGALPGAAGALARCARIFEERRGDASIEEHLFNPRKRFLLALLSGADFCAYPELIRFMVSRPVLDAATDYLGTVPILAGAALWWTPDNDTAERSQLFHFDGEDERQVKLILNVFDTDESHGPFTLLPADVSAPLRRPGALRRRLSDEQVDAACGLEKAVSFVGPAGSGGFVDTCRCLHFGSRHTRGDRLVLMVQFTRFHCPTESTFDFEVPPDLAGLDPDPMQKLALGIE
jgi:hypothetical protein